MNRPEQTKEKVLLQLNGRQTSVPSRLKIIDEEGFVEVTGGCFPDQTIIPCSETIPLRR